jgi:hypothetical protein
MMEYLIEKNVPITKPSAAKTERPWPNMEVNDSVFIAFPCQDKRPRARSGTPAAPLYHKQDAQLRCSAHVYGTKNKKKFVTRVLTENGKIGLRVWRVE